MKHIFLIISAVLAYSPLYAQHYQYTLAYQDALKAAEDDPSNAQKLVSLGFFLKKLNRYEEAIAVYEYARPHIKHRSTIERALSGAYLALGDFQRGWPAYEYRWANPPEYNQELKQYLDAGGSLANKIVVLKTEYGLGDTLHFIRYAQLLKEKGAHVILECQKSLIPLLSRCPYLDEIKPQGSVIPAHFFALLMSMPLIFNTTLDTIPHTIPYLFADPLLIDQWAKTMRIIKEHNKHKTVHIGLCWQAEMHKNSDNQTVQHDAHAKSIPVEMLAELAQLPHIQLYSLQKVHGLENLESMQTIIKQFDELDTMNGPFMDTAALMNNLDLVITIDTSIAHLAGGLGVPCWLLLNAAADWRWMIQRDNSPWYSTMRLFRQHQQDDWQSVLDEVIQALQTTTHHVRQTNK